MFIDLVYMKKLKVLSIAVKCTKCWRSPLCDNKLYVQTSLYYLLHEVDTSTV